jgi:hypothetical protein
MNKANSTSAIMRGGIDDPHCLLPGAYNVFATALGCSFYVPRAKNGWAAIDIAKHDRSGALEGLSMRGRTRGWIVTKAKA